MHHRQFKHLSLMLIVAFVLLVIPCSSHAQPRRWNDWWNGDPQPEAPFTLEQLVLDLRLPTFLSTSQTPFLFSYDLGPGFLGFGLKNQFMGSRARAVGFSSGVSLTLPAEFLFTNSGTSLEFFFSAGGYTDLSLFGDHRNARFFMGPAFGVALMQSSFIKKYGVVQTPLATLGYMPGFDVLDQTLLFQQTFSLTMMF